MTEEYTYDVAEPKHPDSNEPYFVVWCDPTGLNSGAAADEGELQGETITTVDWDVPDDLTKGVTNQDAVTINGTTYAANTVATVWLSGGIDGSFYEITCKIHTATRILPKTFVLPVTKKM